MPYMVMIARAFNPDRKGACRLFCKVVMAQISKDRHIYELWRDIQYIIWNASLRHYTIRLLLWK